ncbi:MAG: aspartate--ammonia ligase, partial [Chitinispirillaceae bacterium]|nr:aspartate--ammonia ligase [Chitinispirillaceae bacterium]
MMVDKKADLAGPGISTYEEVDKILPHHYQSLLSHKERMKALFRVKNFIEENLCKELNLFMVQVPLIVTRQSGVNDYLDRDGSRTPIEFECGLGLEKRIETQVVQAATKWKRMALKQFDCRVGEGICTDMRAVRKDYFLDHDHSAYVDQWDWERVITADMRNLDFLRNVVEKIWSVIYEAGRMVEKEFPGLAAGGYPAIPKKLEFFHAEEILERFPDLTRKQRETKMVQEVSPAIFIIGIGYVLEDGYPHEMRAADYDDWISPTITRNGKQYHGLNGDILVWNPVTRRRHELTSMGIRVTKETLVQQLKEADQEHFLQLPYHRAILNDEIPLSIGGGIGQSRTFMYLLRTAHLGEVSTTVWPDVL